VGELTFQFNLADKSSFGAEICALLIDSHLQAKAQGLSDNLRRSHLSHSFAKEQSL